MRTLLIAGNWKMNPTSTEAAVALAEGGQGGRGHGDRRPRRRLPAVRLPRAGSTRLSKARRSAWAARTCTGSPTGRLPARSRARCSSTPAAPTSSWATASGGTAWARPTPRSTRKLNAALAGRLIPIVCIGETKEERLAEQTEAVLLDAVDRLARRPLARADGRHRARLRAGLGDRHRPDGHPRAGPGGPCVHPRLARPDVRRGDGRPGRRPVRRERQAGQRRELLACPDIDGALVGGASLKASDFLAIIQAGQDVTARGKADCLGRQRQIADGRR